MKIDWKRGLSYWFIHFSVEVICFYTVFRVFKNSELWWMVSVLYDTLAFAPQALIGAISEKYPKLKPGVIGGVMLLTGSALALIAKADIALAVVGIVILAIGNAFVHISGALVTLRVSEGRLSESALFVGGGSFGLISGRMLSKLDKTEFLPFILMAAALILIYIVDTKMRKADPDCYDFDKTPCAHNLAADRPYSVIILILGLVVMVRAYIGYGLPTAWNQTSIQTLFLFIFMGLGKMSGGILADLFGARRVGVISCIAAVPLLLVSNNIMWLSLIGVACFSMTMAITLGGLVSVLKSNPGVAFGITTIGLLLGTLPIFFVPMPSRTVCNILIAIMSLLAAAGLEFALKAPAKE